MKAITILQPYASLIVAGAKQYETRSWDTPYRGIIAIHAGKNKPFEYGGELRDKTQGILGKRMEELPKGSIIAVADLVECYQVMGNSSGERWMESKPAMNPDGTYRLGADGHRIGWEEIPLPTGDELMFGHYGLEMYAWKLANIRPLPKPLPCRGNQRIWEVPDEMIAAALKEVGGC